ncbi:MAG: type III pantothenate kinase [Chlorobium sp.]|uniref:type III pantothenate kinase n=1 Tax=Chlorobium sp. TaxID=1095 RepID=UPI0025C1FE8C|nr:type III pantothenate kinase [Chlorobium sp.]MCF8217130.1 type III pantothenate kinase [Chlorobium sp.]MCF8271977.1 type III pantothenate kinase [Chlorobium sp.]MCF8288348.1 type III pantothenate kinase [Chlorobium sp.]MCF8291939.1 type III pantothenate kinase [Chlorobium sp.]MCF8386047.1 type III pantothenate kinase [Chlorobium sp.]
MLPSGKENSLLVVDIGNTTVTCAVFVKDAVVELFGFPTDTLTEPDMLPAAFHPLASVNPFVQNAMLCSVVPAVSGPVKDYLSGVLGGQIFQVSFDMKLPFSLSYDTPSSFGVDRIALCAAGRKLYPGKPLIALDIGTAITIDVLSADGQYLGGFIIPGLDLMAAALHEKTAQLPFVTIERPSELLGRSTVSCIRNGVFWGCVAQIDGLVARIICELQKQRENDPAFMVTGGNATAVAGLLAARPQLVEHAVAKGACYLYELNASRQ